MAVDNETIVAFINQLGNLAVAEANRRIANGGKFILPSVVIAQSAHETGWGTSSFGRALPWHGRGEEFESPVLHHFCC